jgi:hypothetical protein
MENIQHICWVNHSNTTILIRRRLYRATASAACATTPTTTVILSQTITPIAAIPAQQCPKLVGTQQPYQNKAFVVAVFILSRWLLIRQMMIW